MEKFDEKVLKKVGLGNLLSNVREKLSVPGAGDRKLERETG